MATTNNYSLMLNSSVESQGMAKRSGENAGFYCEQVEREVRNLAK